jgi:hypothetical protein
MKQTHSYLPRKIATPSELYFADSVGPDRRHADRLSWARRPVVAIDGPRCWAEVAKHEMGVALPANAMTGLLTDCRRRVR